MTTSEVEKLVAEWRKRKEFAVPLCELEAAIQQDKDRAGEAVCFIDQYDLAEKLALRGSATVVPLYTRPAQPAEVTDAMVERAAVALFLADGGGHEDEWREDELAGLRKVFRQAARAALTAALRLPDEQAGGRNG